MNAPHIPLPILIASLRAAKVAEEQAKDVRQALEEQIVALFPKPAGGEGTEKSDDLTVTFKLNRSVDTEALQTDWTALSANAQRAFKWKAEVDLKQLRALHEFDETAYRQAAQFFTAKPAKPSVTLKSET